jgi:hypothetical protein
LYGKDVTVMSNSPTHCLNKKSGEIGLIHNDNKISSYSETPKSKILRHIICFKKKIMKKLFAILIITLCLPLLSQACDTCDCSTGNQYIGILPDFNKSTFGLKYHYSSVHSRVYTDDATYRTTLEKYNTVELWGAWNITDKIGIMGSVPYRFESFNDQVVTTSKSGLGDIYLFGYYELLHHSHTIRSGKSLVQNLWFGAGIELPTGKYDPADKSMLNDTVNLYQLGSGSTDVPFNVIYNICLPDAGLNVSSMYKINTVNKNVYEYGNRFNINAQAYYKFSIKHKLAVMPVIGIQFENFQQSMDHHDWVEASNGNLITGTIGIQTNFKTISIGGNFQIPLQQNIGNEIIKFNNTYMVQVSFAL